MRLLRSISFILLFAIPFVGYSQDVYDAMAGETCECLSGKDLSGLSEDDRNMELGFCIMESLAAHQEEINIDISDQAAMQGLGEKIGLRMATKCPVVLQKVAVVETRTEVNTERVMTVTGVIKRIEGEDFNYLVLEDDSGREQKYLWLRYFKGSDKLIGDPNGLNGKKVKLTYGMIECYSPKAGDYYNQKEIKSLEVL